MGAGSFFVNAGSVSGGPRVLAAFDATSGALQAGYVLPADSPVRVDGCGWAAAGDLRGDPE